MTLYTSTFYSNRKNNEPWTCPSAILQRMCTSCPPLYTACQTRASCPSRLAPIVVLTGNTSVADPGSGAFFPRGPDHISRSLVTIFCVKNTKILCCWSGSVIWCFSDPGSGMEKFGSEINIRDPQHLGKPVRKFLSCRQLGIPTILINKTVT